MFLLLPHRKNQMRVLKCIKRINPLQNRNKNFLCQIKRKFPLSGLPIGKRIDFPVVSPDQFIRRFFILFFLILRINWLSVCMHVHRLYLRSLRYTKYDTK